MTKEEAITYLEDAKWDLPYKFGQAIDMAIEVLSAETVPQSEQYKKGFEDAKRAFLVEYARESKNMRKRNAQLEVMLNAQKAISAEAEWIPCSERLPDVGERCLVTLSNKVVAIGTLHSAGEYEDDFGYIVSWGKRWHLEPASMMIAYPEDSVVAWMPLPKPYELRCNEI